MKAFLDGHQAPEHKSTYTGAGVKMTLDEFNARGRHDKGVAKLCFLITDGAPTDPFTVDEQVCIKYKIRQKIKFYFKSILESYHHYPSSRFLPSSFLQL